VERKTKEVRATLIFSKENSRQLNKLKFILNHKIFDNKNGIKFARLIYMRVLKAFFEQLDILSQSVQKPLVIHRIASIIKIFYKPKASHLSCTTLPPNITILHHQQRGDLSGFGEHCLDY
jgi:hypothetical protein